MFAIVGVFPLGDTALATFLSLERFNFIVDILSLPTDKSEEFGIHLVEAFGTLPAFIIEFQFVRIGYISSGATNLIKITINSIHSFPFVHLENYSRGV